MNSRDRQFWTEFLLLYRSLPAVWKLKSPEYSSRALKSAGYAQLVQKLREVEPQADRALVIKKINSFRTNFRRDMRKRSEGAQSEEPFESTLWYFDLLGFLEGQDSGTESEVQSETVYYQPAKKRRTVYKTEASEIPATTPTNMMPSTATPTTSRLSTQPLSESSALAHTWRSQYDELTSRQKLLARKLISDVLYYGCMDQLEPRHVADLQQLMQTSPQNEDIAASPETCKGDVDAEE